MPMAQLTQIAGCCIWITELVRATDCETQLPGYDVLCCFLPSLLWDMAKVKYSVLAAGNNHS